MIDTIDLILRIVTGLGLGAAIGLERQWRARTAGLRTNALVSLGATLFVIMGAYSFSGPGADPTRVAAQIVSGIGFLGAGVIMKQGVTISGLNTAATLWASAAVGALAGSGLYWIAIGGTLAIMLANTLLRPLGRALDRGHGGGREVLRTEYEFEVHCPTSAEVEVRALVFDAVDRPAFTVQSISSRDLPDSATTVITAVISTPVRDDTELERAIARVIPEASVTAVHWSARELADVD
jgi:putative Mg2+ transporter-C (MgtC) family protein